MSRKIHPFWVYSSMNFDLCIQLCSDHHSQQIEQLHHPKNLPHVTFYSVLFPPLLLFQEYFTVNKIILDKIEYKKKPGWGIGGQVERLAIRNGKVQLLEAKNLNKKSQSQFLKVCYSFQYFPYCVDIRQNKTSESRLYQRESLSKGLQVVEIQSYRSSLKDIHI